MSMNDIDTHNEEVIQSMREDFDLFLAKQDWVNAQAVIDALREIPGNGYSADILRKAFLRAQYESTTDFDNLGKFNEEERESDHNDFVERQGGSYLD